MCVLFRQLQAKDVCVGVHVRARGIVCVCKCVRLIRHACMPVFQATAANLKSKKYQRRNKNGWGGKKEILNAIGLFQWNPDSTNLFNVFFKIPLKIPIWLFFQLIRLKLKPKLSLVSYRDGPSLITFGPHSLLCALIEGWAICMTHCGS